MVDLSKAKKLKFLIDTGAEISIVKSTSLKPGFEYDPPKGINVKGITNALLRTEGTITLTLLTPTHETKHTFHVMGSSFECQYDGLLGRDFWENKEATINYCDRTIIMGEVVLDFDNKTDRAASKHCKLTLKARTEHIVKLPTTFKGHGVISKKELVPRIFLAESLTMGCNGYCVTSIVNTLGKDVTIHPPLVELEEITTTLII
jgi:hypothetical protein